MAMKKEVIFSVMKSSQSMVRPAKPTPSAATGSTLDLSVIDRLPGLNSKVRTFHVFGHDEGRVEPAKVIKDALSKALVHYYPLAGRLIKSENNGELQIACTGDGVWFVEATANCGLDQQIIDYLSHYPLDDIASHHQQQLLPDPRPQFDPADILLLMQVTEFTCGGSVLGLEFCHSICDGLGAAQFLTAVSEFARGLQGPTIEPSWCRESISIKDPTTTPPPPPQLSYRLEQVVVDVSPDTIDRCKSQFFTEGGQRCSVFDVLAASVWQSRTRAINMDADTDVQLVFLANARSLVRPELPPGFYGNCFFPVNVTARSGWLVSSPRLEVVKLIKEAKGRLANEIARWAAGESQGDPYHPTLSYTTLFVSEWSRLGFDRIDYGWGPPVQVVPITYSDIIPVCILGSPPKKKKGARLITQCVEEPHLKAFLQQIKDQEL